MQPDKGSRNMRSRQGSQSRHPHSGSRIFAVILSVPALLLTGCATTSGVPLKCPEPPPPPALIEPLPSQTYSENWKLKVEQFRKRLIDMSNQ